MSLRPFCGLLENIARPSGLCFDDRGDLYVTCMTSRVCCIASVRVRGCHPEVYAFLQFCHHTADEAHFAQHKCWQHIGLYTPAMCLQRGRCSMSARIATKY